MAASTKCKNWRDGSVQIKDGTGTPLTSTIAFDQGDLAISGLKAALYETLVIQSRGELRCLRKGNRTFPTVSFTALAPYFTDATTASLADVVRKISGGAWAAAVSTLGSTSDVFTVDLVFTVEGSDFGDAADHTITLEDVELELSFAEGNPSNTFSISGTIYGAIQGI